MVGDEYLLQVVALGDADGDAQHDAVAERHHSRLHVLGGVMSLRDGVGTLQERTLEILVHEAQVDGDVLDAQSLAMHLGERNLSLIVVGAIVETDAQGYLVFLVVEQGDAVHAAAHDDY